MEIGLEGQNLTPRPFVDNRASGVKEHSRRCPPSIIHKLVLPLTKQCFGELVTLPQAELAKRNLQGCGRKLNCKLALKPCLPKLFQASPEVFLLLKKVTISKRTGTWTMQYTWRDQDGRAKLCFSPGSTNIGMLERLDKVGWHRNLPGNSYQPPASVWRWASCPLSPVSSLWHL